MKKSVFVFATALLIIFGVQSQAQVDTTGRDTNTPQDTTIQDTMIQDTSSKYKQSTNLYDFSNVGYYASLQATSPDNRLNTGLYLVFAPSYEALAFNYSLTPVLLWAPETKTNLARYELVRAVTDDDSGVVLRSLQTSV